MPRIQGKANRVLEVDGVFTLTEFLGTLSTQQDNLSVARVVVEKPRAEAWQVNVGFDEWMCVLKGTIELHYSTRAVGVSDEIKILVVNSGETAFVAKGERFRSVFPVADTEMIAICTPAFSPDRCVREEGEATSEDTPRESDEANVKGSSISSSNESDDNEDIIYHMCEIKRWKEALDSGRAYFPPTFEKDGGFTHATLKPSLLLTVANHYYQASQDDWICVALSRAALEEIGIVTRFEEAKPVGSSDVMNTDLRMPHIFGGIPACLPGIVKKVYSIRRDMNGLFLSIEGLLQ